MGFKDRLRAVLAAAPTPQTRHPVESKDFFGSGGDIDRSPPPKDDYHTYRQQYRTFALIKAALDLRATEVTATGYRIEAESDDTVEQLEEWASGAAIIGGEAGHDLLPLIWTIARNYDLDGIDLIEHVYKNPKQKETLLALNLVDPATVSFVTYKNSSILVRPDDDNPPAGVQRTKAGEVACYVQNPSDWGWDKGEQNYLSQNDITKIVRNPVFSDGRATTGVAKANVGSIRGVSLVESISDEVRRVRERLQDYNASIAGQAYPRLQLEFEDYELGDGPGAEIIKWDREDMQAVMNKVTREDDEKKFSVGEEWTDPGGSFGTPPGVTPNLVTGDVADVVPSLEFSVDYILSGLEVPKYAIGFEDDINRDISGEQETRLDKSAAATKRDIERALTPIFEEKAEELSLSTEGLQFRLEAEEAQNPLQDEEFDADEFQKVTKAIGDFMNSNAAVEVDTVEFLSELLNMDLEEFEVDIEEQPVDESDPQVQEQFASDGDETAEAEESSE